IPAPLSMRRSAASRIARSFRECASSRRSNSSSSSTPTSTATALPFRVTTTGPAALALRYALSRALISATDAIFIASPLLRQGILGCSLSRRCPGCELAAVRHPRDRRPESDCPAPGGAPTGLPKQSAAQAAFGYEPASLV